MYDSTQNEAFLLKEVRTLHFSRNPVIGKNEYKKKWGTPHNTSCKRTQSAVLRSTAVSYQDTVAVQIFPLTEAMQDV